MRVARFASEKIIKYGIIDNSLISGLKQSPFIETDTDSQKFALDGTTYSIDRVQLLAPCVPSKIVCLGVNYKTHADEMPSISQPTPVIFLKPPSAVIGPGENIIMPPNWEQVDYEGELAIIIGKTARQVSVDDAFQRPCVGIVTDVAKGDIGEAVSTVKQRVTNAIKATVRTLRIPQQTQCAERRGRRAN